MKKRGFVVTPWEVYGDVDYKKLITEFGIKEIDIYLLKRIGGIAKELHHFLRRGIFFAHRDLDWVLEEYEKGNKFFLYTGRAPSGNTHLGHLVPWMLTKWLQDKFDADLWFQFPDEEKFLFKEKLTFEEIEKHTFENMLDVIALGFSQKKTKFLVDTKNANLMYKEAIKVAKKINFSNVKAAFGLNNESNIGSIFYTAMQAVPAFLPSVLAKKNMPCLIPYGIDQDPHFRLTRDVIEKLGYYKPASIQCRFLPALQGASGKMSTSVGEHSTIFTTDSPQEVRKKIMKYAFSGGANSIEEHRKKGGNPDIDVSYQWLTFFEKDDTRLKRVYEDYKSGKMLTGELKDILIENINSFLKEHQRKRERAKNNVEKFLVKG